MRAVETVPQLRADVRAGLVSSLQYYQNHPGSLGIGEIALTAARLTCLGLPKSSSA